MNRLLWILIAETHIQGSHVSYWVWKQWPSMYQRWRKSWQLKYFLDVCDIVVDRRQVKMIREIAMLEQGRWRGVGAVCHQPMSLVGTDQNKGWHSYPQTFQWMLAANEQNCEYGVTLASTKHGEISPLSILEYIHRVWWNISIKYGEIYIWEKLHLFWLCFMKWNFSRL